MKAEPSPLLLAIDNDFRTYAVEQKNSSMKHQTV